MLSNFKDCRIILYCSEGLSAASVEPVCVMKDVWRPFGWQLCSEAESAVQQYIHFMILMCMHTKIYNIRIYLQQLCNILCKSMAFDIPCLYKCANIQALLSRTVNGHIFNLIKMSRDAPCARNQKARCSPILLTSLHSSNLPFGLYH